MTVRIVISACLMGVHCRYDGAARVHEDLEALKRTAILVPVCPEILGGLGIPRPKCRFVGGDGTAVLKAAAGVVDSAGADRTDNFVMGARETALIVEATSPDLIIFKDGSPSCGVTRVDVEGRRQPGVGVTTAHLHALGIRIISESDPWRDLCPAKP